MKSIIAEQYEEEILTVASETSNEITEEEDFKPKGAVAFFVLLMILCAAIWYGIYYIAVARQ